MFCFVSFVWEGRKRRKGELVRALGMGPGKTRRKTRGKMTGNSRGKTRWGGARL